MYTYAGVYALAISILFSNPGWGGGAKNIRALFTPSRLVRVSYCGSQKTFKTNQK